MSNISFLTLDNVDEMLALQQVVIDYLIARGEEHFIIKRDRAYFEENVTSPSRILGLRDDSGELIAQSIFHHSDQLCPNYIKGVSLQNLEPTDAVSTLQGVLVHPSQQGKSLSSVLVEAWIEWAEKQGYEHIITRVEENNSKSMAAFTKAGLDTAGKIIDARDGATICVLHGRFSHD